MARMRGGGDLADCNSRGLLYYVVVLCFITANAQGPGGKKTWIISMKDDAKQIMGISDLSVQDQHVSILDTVLGFGSDYLKVHDFDACFDGMAVVLSDEQAAALKSNPLIRSMELDEIMYVSTTHSPDYMLLPIAGGAWNKSGGIHNAGEDIVIGVVDTGIYPDHPSFAADDGVKPYGQLPTFLAKCGTDSRVPGGFCNGKIVGAQHFFDGALASGTMNNSDPDALSPLDANGHGTHCAGTAAGNYGVPVLVHGVDYGTASGTAPRARISVYKALNAEGTGRSSDIIAAIDQAVKDGVHILSLSLGGSTPSGNVTYTNGLSMACLGAVKAGVYVVHAGGNTGPEPSTVVSYSPWLTTVGATTMDRSYPAYLYTSDGQSYSGLGLTLGTPGTTNYALVRAADTVASQANLNPDFDCDDATLLNKKLIQGKILICTFSGMIDGLNPSISSRIAAKATGAVGLVLVDGRVFLETYSPGSLNFLNFPSIMINGKTAQLFAQSFQAGLTGRLSGGGKAEFTGLPPKVATFSSRGPNVYEGFTEVSPTSHPVADVLKPNIVAPGVDIWAAYSPLQTEKVNFQGQKWGMISGTSMATPHLAGVAALVKQFHPDWSPSTIASALATTAIFLDSLDNPLVAYDQEHDINTDTKRLFKRPGNAFDFGHGFVDSWAALDPGLIFDATYTDYVDFLCSVGSLSPASVQAASGATCSPGIHKSTDLNLPSITIGILTGTLSVPRVVTNVGPLETYTAVIFNPTDVEVSVDPLTFTISPGKTQSLTVTLKALKNAVYLNQTSFGRIELTGSWGHRVKVPVTVTYKQTS